MGFPLLGGIPVLGNLFKSVKNEVNRQELIVLLQPSVIESEEDLRRTNSSEQRRTNISEEAVELMEEPPLPVREAIAVHPQEKSARSPKRPQAHRR